MDIEEISKTMEREFADRLPSQGDRVFAPSGDGAYVDPLGMTAPGQQRRSTGRWQLYADGFLQAGDRLVDGLLGAPHEDCLIYPILTLYGHHLELELKLVIRISRTRALETELKTEHSLLKLWSLLKQAYPRFGIWASNECTHSCEELIREFDAHYCRSQAGRYPFDTRNQQTLTALEVIDMRVLKTSVHKISNYLAAVYEQIAEDHEQQDCS